MEKIVFYKTQNTEGVSRSFLGLARPYQSLTEVFMYFAMVNPEQEQWAMSALAGGVPYLDKYGDPYPDGRKYHPSYACVNFQDPNKTLWLSRAALIGLLNEDNNLVLVEEEDNF